MDLPVLAGVISTILFAISTLPMLHKAFRTKDLTSYSAGKHRDEQRGQRLSFRLRVQPAGRPDLVPALLLCRLGRPDADLVPAVPDGSAGLHGPAAACQNLPVRTRGTGRGLPPQPQSHSQNWRQWHEHPAEQRIRMASST